MALAIDIIDRHDLSNETRHQLQPKKTKGKAVLAIYKAAKDVLSVLYY